MGNGWQDIEGLTFERFNSKKNAKHLRSREQNSNLKKLIGFDFTKHKCKYLQENANVWIGMKLKVGNLRIVKPNIWENFEKF